MANFSTMVCGHFVEVGNNGLEGEFEGYDELVRAIESASHLEIMNISFVAWRCFENYAPS